MHASFAHGLDRGRRHRSARRLMADSDLDALVLTGGPNLSYFAGASGMLEGNSGSRPVLYVLPRDGAPVLITHELSDDTIDIPGVDASVRTYQSLSSLPAAQLREALAASDLIGGRIGMELGPETTLSVPIGEFTTFTASLPETEFVDAQPLLVDLRSHKSMAEIERIERACEITAEAYERTFQAISGGVTGAEIESRFCCALLELGGRNPWAFVTHGAGTYHTTASGGTDQAVEAGDMVWIDGGCSVDGYYSDYSRAGVIGGSSSDQRSAHEQIHQITQAAVDAIEPGVRLADVATEAEQAIDALDVPITSRLSKQAGRIGHSLGLQITELPSVSAASEHTFEPGMVVTVEPAFATADGTFHVEENVLVTDSGTRKLSPETWQLHTLSR